ncbi:MAG: hypothetical protein H7647_05995 [Candidatus Heimdallarchaeota archaeon]|jgi:hypothetical protein|nr:hypothetical protein [Candidatus Heimdallarchaeota archaeon]MCK4253977.1 hypothetical protein [Candidatus Heimdallarchaeota archaeon]
MSSDITDIGLKSLSDDELEEIILLVDKKIELFLQNHKSWKLLTDFGVIVSLSQDSDNVLTLILDFDISGGLSSLHLDELQQEVYEYAQEALKEELLCRKNS